jgi:DNA replication licensing factor MCM2
MVKESVIWVNVSYRTWKKYTEPMLKDFLLWVLLGNGESFEVNYEHLVHSKAVIAYFLANSPVAMLKILDEVALEVTLMQYPEYERIHRDIHVRITDLPTANTLRELRQNQLNCMIRVSGVVTRRTGVFPQLKWVKYNCAKCNQLLGPFYQDIHSEIKINTCPSCQSKGPFNVNMEEVTKLKGLVTVIRPMGILTLALVDCVP